MRYALCDYTIHVNILSKIRYSWQKTETLISTVRHTQLNYELLKMNIEILKSYLLSFVLNINNYLYIKNKDYISKIDSEHIFYWTCVKQCIY